MRLTDVEGNVFEGIAEYNSADYCEHEYGREQACLQIVNFCNYSVPHPKNLIDLT